MFRVTRARAGNGPAVTEHIEADLPIPQSKPKRKLQAQTAKSTPRAANTARESTSNGAGKPGAENAKRRGRPRKVPDATPTDIPDNCPSSANIIPQVHEEAIATDADVNLTTTATTPTRAHHYNTRETNDPHPARTAGVASRQMEEIHAEAERKRAEKDALVKAKQHEAEEKLRAYQNSLRELAEFQCDLDLQVGLDASGDQLGIIATRPDVGVESMIPPHAPKKSSKKIEQRTSILHTLEIETAAAHHRRQQEQVSNTTSSRKRKAANTSDSELNTTLETSTVVAATKKRKFTNTNPKPTGALNSNWQSRVKPVYSKSSSLPAPNSSGPLPALKSGKHASSDLIGGFTDEDVKMTGPVGGVQWVRRKPLVGVVSTGGRGNLKSEPPIHSTRRAPKTEVPIEESISVASLPEAVQMHWNSELIPSLLEAAGCNSNPWNFEKDDNMFIDVLQDLVDNIFPEMQHDVVKGDKIYRIAKQALATWRKQLLTAATSIVREELSLRGLTGPRTIVAIEDVRGWVIDALRFANGAAFWEKPGTHPNEASSFCMLGHGALQSIFILRTLAVHLSVIKGSMWSTLNGSVEALLPHGALGIAVTAVERVFKMWSTGVLVLNTKQFSANNYAKMTDDWMKNSIKRLVKKPLEFQQLVAKSTVYVKVDKESDCGMTSDSTGAESGRGLVADSSDIEPDVESDADGGRPAEFSAED